MIEPTQILYLIIFLFLASVTNSLAGFGFALVAAATLLELFGLLVSTPLISACALVVKIILVYTYWEHIRWPQLRPIVVASLCAIPLGVIALDYVPDLFMRTMLGVVIVGYVVYKVMGAAVPDLKSVWWAYAAGFAGGLLGGAYNTAGPPVVIYTDTQDWKPDMFRANMQTYLLCNNILALSLHFWRGNLTAEVGQLFLWAIPALVAGTFFGNWLCRFVSPEFFRKLVLFILFVIGIRLAMTYWL